MSTQALGGRKSPKAIVGIVALTLAVAVFVLATQATSLWSSKGSAELQPAPARVATVVTTHPVNGSQIPAGCRVKFGCDRGVPRYAYLGLGGQMPHGCPIASGCGAPVGARIHSSG